MSRGRPWPVPPRGTLTGLLVALRAGPRIRRPRGPGGRGGRRPRGGARGVARPADGRRPGAPRPPASSPSPVPGPGRGRSRGLGVRTSRGPGAIPRLARRPGRLRQVHPPRRSRPIGPGSRPTRPDPVQGCHGGPLASSSCSPRPRTSPPDRPSSVPPGARTSC